jgi:hypothetical protein
MRRGHGQPPEKKQKKRSYEKQPGAKLSEHEKRSQPHAASRIVHKHATDRRARGGQVVLGTDMSRTRSRVPSPPRHVDRYSAGPCI